MDCCWVMVQIRINCHVRRKPTGSIPVQFYFFCYKQTFIKGVPVVHIPKRQHVLIDYTTTNQTYGACCRHSVSVICDEKTYQR
nr:MAG TPA: hypothetical protein [Caudoviricetes sp.]